VKEAIDAHAYPASVLYAPREWINANRVTAARLARAITKTLKWMHAHTPQEIAARTPKAFQGEDESLYVDALKNSLPMFSPDGVMDADGPKAVRTLLDGSMEKVRGAPIDLTNTYTNEFIDGR
jgi:NitT/TauT family transport system substrate-binding protein